MKSRFLQVLIILLLIEEASILGTGYYQTVALPESGVKFPVPLLVSSIQCHLLDGRFFPQYQG